MYTYILQRVRAVNFNFKDKSVRYFYIELIVVFYAVPVFYAFNKGASPIPFLIFLAIACVVNLIRSAEFDRKCFFTLGGFRQHYRWMLIRFAVLAPVIAVFTALYAPESLFAFMMEDTGRWAAVMLLYPLLSVYPQEIVYRAFFFKRYKNIFTDSRELVLISSLSFAFAHIIYLNPVSVLFSLAGGYIFADTYQKTRSLIAVSIEHAFYGWLIFTIGLGRFFYAG